MATCPQCQRPLPISGQCPFCKQAGAGGFSLKGLLQKKPAEEKPESAAAPPEVSLPSLEEEATPEFEFPQDSQNASEPEDPFLDLPTPPIPRSPQPPAGPAPLPTPPAGGSILASLRGKSAESPGAALPSARMGPQPTPPAPPAPPRPTAVPPTGHASTPAPQSVIPPKATPARPSLPTSTPNVPVPVTKPEHAAGEGADNEGLYSSQSTGFGDEEMEFALLAGLLNDQFILEQAISKGLIADLFSNKSSRALCRAILSLREENREGTLIDKIILKNKLKQLGMYDLPTQTYLERVLTQPNPTLDQVLHYLELMKEGALKRKLKDIANGIHTFLDHPDPANPVSIENFTNVLVRDIREIQKSKSSKKINLVKEEMRDIIKDVEDREVRGEVDIIGFSFAPMDYLNLAISGFRKGFMYAIAGAPRRGKTTFTLELATLTATNNRIPVLFFTYEQTKKNLTYRLLAKESRLNPDSLQRKKIRSDMIMDAKFMGGWKRMQSYMDYFYIIEASKQDTIDRIRSYAYNVMQDFNTEDIMIFVDYIQKMPLSRSYMDEKFKVEEISTELKGLSIELNNPIMTISSLSKEGCMIDATSDSERPTMYHCKGSGDLEYDLDCAMIQAKDWGDTRELYQQLQHKAEELGKDPTRVPKVDVVNLYLDKNRDAPEGIFSTIQYLFFIEDNKFIELGPKFEDDRFRFSKIEQLVDELIQKNYIVFFDKPRDAQYAKGRVNIKLKNH